MHQFTIRSVGFLMLHSYDFVCPRTDVCQLVAGTLRDIVHRTAEHKKLQSYSYGEEQLSSASGSGSTTGGGEEAGLLQSRDAMALAPNGYGHAKRHADAAVANKAGGAYRADAVAEAASIRRRARGAGNIVI